LADLDKTVPERFAISMSSLIALVGVGRKRDESSEFHATAECYCPDLRLGAQFGDWQARMPLAGRRRGELILEHGPTISSTSTAPKNVAIPQIASEALS
jgi:hypothetical protein